ncbi:MAG: hypothetical protein Q4A65_05520 [Bacillota bacterium]|nr:hypothetical protein [Bacillota bacterium]
MSKRIKRVYAVVAVLMLILIAFEVFPPFMGFWNQPLRAMGIPYSEWLLFVDSILMCAVLIVGNLIENHIDKQEQEKRKRGEKIDY